MERRETSLALMDKGLRAESPVGLNGRRAVLWTRLKYWSNSYSKSRGNATSSAVSFVRVYKFLISGSFISV